MGRENTGHQSIGKRELMRSGGFIFIFLTSVQNGSIPRTAWDVLQRRTSPAVTLTAMSVRREAISRISAQRSRKTHRMGSASDGGTTSSTSARRIGLHGCGLSAALSAPSSQFHLVEPSDVKIICIRNLSAHNRPRPASAECLTCFHAAVGLPINAQIQSA